jgi:hypothetical protein
LQVLFEKRITPGHFAKSHYKIIMGISQSSFQNQSALNIVGSFIICQSSINYLFDGPQHKDRNIAYMIVGAGLVEASKWLGPPAGPAIGPGQ